MVKKTTKPKVSVEEQKYRKSLFPEVSNIRNKNVLCTSCNSSVKELVLRGKPIAHPFLDTLLCEKCDDFFGDGEFSVDEDGSDKYCRWCGQGGTLYLCSTCTAGFCKKCIKRNLPRSALVEVEDDNWQCYCCDVKPLYDLRALCWAAQTYSTSQTKKKLSDVKKRKLRNRSSSSSEENGSFDKKRRITRREGVSNESNPLDKHIKKHVRVGALKMSEFLTDTVCMVELLKKKGMEYQSKKTTVKALKSVDSIINFANKVDSMLENIENSSRKMRENLSNFIEAWKKTIEEGGSLTNEKDKSSDKEEDDSLKNENDKSSDKEEDDSLKNENDKSSDKEEDDSLKNENDKSSDKEEDDSLKNENVKSSDKEEDDSLKNENDKSSDKEDDEVMDVDKGSDSENDLKGDKHTGTDSEQMKSDDEGKSEEEIKFLEKAKEHGDGEKAESEKPEYKSDVEPDLEDNKSNVDSNSTKDPLEEMSNGNSSDHDETAKEESSSI